MNRDTTIYLRDIIENVQLAADFVKNITREAFASDRKTAYAVLRCLEVVAAIICGTLMILSSIIAKNQSSRQISADRINTISDISGLLC